MLTCISGHPILNDILRVATSYLIYDYEDLRNHIWDSTYPIPEIDKFKNHQELKVCSGGNESPSILLIIDPREWSFQEAV
jgi:hypothetical protein